MAEAVPVLVIDGNKAATRAAQRAEGGSDSGEAYARTLEALAADAGARLQCSIVRPADGPVELPDGRAIGDFAGAAITGSALNVYEPETAVTRQVELARGVFAAGVPLFGSCWGLQVACAAAGGRVEPNPLGREFGFARRIELTGDGVRHPMFAGKPPVFEAITVHRDCIAELPPGSQELARNDFGVQAAEIRFGRGCCWGVQYHPEYTLEEIAATARRYAAPFLREGIFEDPADLDRFVTELRALGASSQRRAIAWRHGLGPGVLNRELRLAELRNWLRSAVLR
jgi:GMP synthase (glutamine-hydrolysing)